MDESKISVRYARALLSLAVEKQVEESVKNDIEIIYELFQSIPGFSLLLESPVVGTKEKQQFFKNVFAERVNPMTYSFLMLLITNNREAYLKAISRNFLKSYRKAAGFKDAVLISAVSVDQSTVHQFKALIRQQFETEVDLICEVDPKLIGGFVLQVEDQQIDASVSAKLKRLKRELLESQN